MNTGFTPEIRARVRADNQQSAHEIVPVVYDLLKPQSVVDVGCGEAHFLAEFEKCGITNLVGLEGDANAIQYAEANYPRVAVCQFDLTESKSIPARFDLALCLEVAEHLRSESADTLVDTLCALSDKILFSAAVPGQGGIGHLNEQWASYWVEKFWSRGLSVTDRLRWYFWHNAKVETWYSQNLLLFFKGQELVDKSSYNHADDFNVIHPRLWSYYRNVSAP